MPSPIGHALAGAAIAWMTEASTSRSTGDRDGKPEGLYHLSRLTVACAALAVLPDADLLLPIAHRTATHSVTAVLAVALSMIVAGAVTGKVTAGAGGACAAAWASHLLLDWLQADPTPPLGIQLLWPFSRAWFLSGLDIFRATERRHVFEAATIGRNGLAMLQEIAILVPVAAAAWLIRVKALAGLPPVVARRNQPLQ